MTMVRQGPALRLTVKPALRDRTQERRIARMRKLAEDHPDEMLAVMLDAHFWPKELAPDIAYTRYDDDSRLGMLSVNFSRDGDAWIAATPDDYERNFMHRFRTFHGGGESIRVRNALVFLGVAIEADNRERPQHRTPRPKEA